MTASQEKIHYIAMSFSVQQALGKHLSACYPHEACGLLLGAAAAGGMRIDTYVPLRNVAPDPLHAFLPHPQEWIRGLYHNPSPIGLFHSHPSAPPLPSAADIRGLSALGPEFKAYLIGSPPSKDEDPPLIHAYLIDRQHDGAATSPLTQVPLQVLLR